MTSCSFAYTPCILFQRGEGARPLKTTIKNNDMAFEKGQSGNPKGRTKGKPNKVTKRIRDFVARLIDKNRELLMEDIVSLKPKDRLMIIERLLQYVIPKMESQKAEISIENLTDADLSSIAEDILIKMGYDEDTVDQG